MQSPTNNSTPAPALTTKINKPILQIGSKGSEVKELQKLLIHWGYLCDRPIDGIFDDRIEAAVKTYQYRVFLKQDGIVGPNTWQALYTGAPVNLPVLRKGSKGELVVKLQRVLQITNDYTYSIDGDFGPRTDAAVRSFQKRNRLFVDGVVGNKTWLVLSKVYQPPAC